MSSEGQNLETLLRERLGERLFGVDDVIRALVIALLARGHVLLEGAPGLGKTFLGKSFAQLLGGRFNRVQGTADLMPTDITGVHVFDAARGDFVFREGPVFTDLLLIDEVNRASPKTQSALLEAMEERQVTVDRESFALAEDFTVVATQNPREYEGTYPLPESQLDRFLLSVRMTYPERAEEARVLERYAVPERVAPLAAEVGEGVVARARAEVGGVHVSQELVGYVLDIAATSRQSENIALGLSSRGALALLLSARVEALLRGADYAIPDDVKRVAPWVMRHRLMLAPEALLDGGAAEAEVERILESVPVPR